jgi:hypothetical protein
LLLICFAAFVAAQNQPVAPPVRAGANTGTGGAGRADAARRDAWFAAPGSDNKLPMKDFAQYLNNHLASEKKRSVVAGTTLLSTSFSSNAEGWTAIFKNTGNPAEVAWSAGAISFASSGANTPYFVSSSAWSGDFSAAYNGALTITTGPLSYSGNLAAGSNYDVELVSKCGHALTMSGIFKEAVQTYKLTLNEDSGWMDSRMGKKPTIFDFNGVLANLQSINIRASLHSESATNTLSQVTVTAGIKWYPCCTLDDTIDICATPGSPYYNPAQLKFYCEGSRAQIIRVLRVSPRFARRTGGALITVSGQNFGLPGSRPTVRIGGLQCQSTTYLNDRITETSLGVVQSSVLLCRSPVHRGFDHSVTVTAESGSVEGPYQVRSNSGRTAWVNVGSDATSCSSDDSHGFEFGAHDFVSVTEFLNFVTTAGNVGSGLAPTNVAVKRIATAVDRNTGDIYTLGNIGNTNPLKTKGVHISGSNENALSCASSGKCLFLMKADRNNNPLWSTVIQGVPANDVTPWGLEIDPSGTKPHVFITGATNFASATASTVKFNSAMNAASVASTTVHYVTLGSRASGNFPGSPEFCRGFLAKYNGDTGTALWATPVCGTANAANTEFSMLLSVFRASTSLIINTEETSDNPSDSPIKGFLRDNGGVFAAGTVKVGATAETVNFGIESAIFAANSNSDSEQQAILGGAEAQWGYVVKYDTDGRVLWARKISSSGSAPVVTSVTAMGDKVYVSGYAPANLDRIDSCTFTTSMAPGSGAAADKSDKFKCTGSAPELYTPAIPANSLFVIAYDASGSVIWTQNFLKSGTVASTANGWGANSILASVSAVRGARPLKGNTDGWNSLETLLGRDQPPMGEINGIGSENFDKSISKGRFVYLSGIFSSSETLTVSNPMFPEIRAGTTVTLTAGTPLKTFLVKMNAKTGQNQWAQMYPPTSESSHHVVASDLKVDDITGAVYMTGTITNVAEFANSAACNLNDANSLCGFDLFGLGNTRKVGCPVDPRPFIGSLNRCQDTADGTILSAECQTGVLNKEFGLPYCRFVPIGYALGSKTGFLAKISDGYTDQYRRTLSDNFGPGQDPSQAAIDAVKSNVQWFKVLGNGHGHTFGGTTPTNGLVQTQGHSLSIFNSDLIVGGLHYVPASTVANGRLQFPGVHTLYQNEPLSATAIQLAIPGGRQTIYGTDDSLGLRDGIVSPSSSAPSNGAFVALLKD